MANQIYKITPQGELTLCGSCPDTGIIVIYFSVVSQVFVGVLRHRLGVHKCLLEETKQMTQPGLRFFFAYCLGILELDFGE